MLRGERRLSSALPTTKNVSILIHTFLISYFLFLPIKFPYSTNSSSITNREKFYGIARMSPACWWVFLSNVLCHVWFYFSISLSKRFDWRFILIQKKINSKTSMRMAVRMWPSWMKRTIVWTCWYRLRLKWRIRTRRRRRSDMRIVIRAYQNCNRSSYLTAIGTTSGWRRRASESAPRTSWNLGSSTPTKSSWT